MASDEVQAAVLESVKKARSHSEKELRKLEKQIFELEGSYLRSFPDFNLVQGFSEQGAAGGPLEGALPEDLSEHRIFSKSSLTSPVFAKSSTKKR